MRNNLTILLLLFISFVFSQETYNIRKEYITSRVNKAPKIDADLSDDIWINLPVAKDFVMFKPEAGKPEPKEKKTEVKIVYDDNAIYIGAYLYDDEPDKILREFQTRDNFGNADFFAIAINPLDDGINQFEFFVTSAGTQNDAVVSSRGEDFSWNAVWDSAVKITDKGWIVEMKIPYSALRFPKQEAQNWGLNFHRQFKRSRDQYSWNPINPEIGNVAQYDGLLKGLKDIEPPIRLSFYPFVSGQISDYVGQSNFDWTAGLDVKYGINDSFTLDATIIPDFGQVGFDDVTLNLGPFEQIYSEKRAFFTEGTELFSKGDLFNSRRIGSSPIGIYDVNLYNNEEIIDNPDKVDVLNIVKISGRTKKGLGIGVLNAVTKNTYAVVKDTITNQTRKILTEPLANYNVFVLDQQFNKNSSISLINTNVIREGTFRDANVSSFLYDVKTKDSKYGVSGENSVSMVSEDNQLTKGTELKFDIGKRSGKHTYAAKFELMDDKYNKNDLGYQRRNNYLSFGGNYSYKIFKPKGIFNTYRIHSYMRVSYLFKMDKNSPSYLERDKKYTGVHIGTNFFGFTKKQLAFGGNISTGIGYDYDYYEPRVEGRFYKDLSALRIHSWISTDYSKKMAVDTGINLGYRYDGDNLWYGFRLEPRYRFNNNFSLIYSFDLGFEKGEKGYVNIDDNEDIIFGKRDTFDLENKLTAKFNFNTKSALALSIRHYWSPIEYNKFYLLEYNGTLSEINYSNNEDLTFNTWNLDFKFNWEFAPGSQFVALYRNSIFKSDYYAEKRVIKNLEELFKQDLEQNFSIKLIYYLDYNQAKHWF